MAKINLKEAYQRLKEASEAFNDSWYLEKTAKGERKKQLQLEMDAAIIRVRIAIDDCPEVLDYIDDFSFNPNHFKSDLELLVSNLSKLNLNEVS